MKRAEYFSLDSTTRRACAPSDRLFARYRIVGVNRPGRRRERVAVDAHALAVDAVGPVRFVRFALAAERLRREVVVGDARLRAAVRLMRRKKTFRWAVKRAMRVS